VLVGGPNTVANRPSAKFPSPLAQISSYATDYMYMENILLAKATFQKQNMNEWHLLWHCSQLR